MTMSPVVQTKGPGVSEPKWTVAQGHPGTSWPSAVSLCARLGVMLSRVWERAGLGLPWEVVGVGYGALG